MTLDPHLESAIKQLRLSGILATVSQRLLQAQESQLSYGEFFRMILQDETQYRQAKQLEIRIKKANFEEEKTHESLELKHYPEKIRKLIHDLLTGHYLREKQHVLIMGPTGTGKTHLAQALGHQACRQGKKVKFIRANEFFRKMRASRADETWEKQFKQYLALDLFILDDFGLKTLTQEQADDIYELIAATHLKGSLIFTSNRRVDAWVKLFPDPVMANAALDRLANQGYHLVLEGESFRRKKRPQGTQEVSIDNT